MEQSDRLHARIPWLSRSKTEELENGSSPEGLAMKSLVEKYGCQCSCDPVLERAAG